MFYFGVNCMFHLIRIVFFCKLFRSGSIVSSSANWRKGSVTIPEKAEDGEEEEDETGIPPSADHPAGPPSLPIGIPAAGAANSNVAVKISTEPDHYQLTHPQETRLQGMRRLSGSNPVPPSSISVLSNKQPPSLTNSGKGRRLSSCGESSSSMDENFLTVPQTVTASSSAETLTGTEFFFP